MVYCKYPILYIVIQPRLQMQTCRHLWPFLSNEFRNSPKPRTEQVIMLEQRWGSSYRSLVGPKSLHQNLYLLVICYLGISPFCSPQLSWKINWIIPWFWTWNKASSLDSIIPAQRGTFCLLMEQISPDKLGSLESSKPKPNKNS